MDDAGAKNPYIPIVLTIVPRLLSNLDRDPQSPTYGCFDRNHWLLKIRPFASAVVQQGCLTLALVQRNNFDGNIYFGNRTIKELYKYAVIVPIPTKVSILAVLYLINLPIPAKNGFPIQKSTTLDKTRSIIE